MNRKRKMLISIALIFIMLLNCMIPFFSVHATTADEIVLNKKLYNAVKTALVKDNVDFTYNDATYTIKISAEVIAKINKLNLNNSDISDLTGLEKFTSLNHLELSANNLSKNSNLAAIANLPLNYLDLSTNKLEDVSEIDGLINSIKNANGTVILTNQTVTIIKIVETAEDGIVNVEFPKILQRAGFIKSAWQTKATDGPTIKNVHVLNDSVSAIDVKLDTSGLLTYRIHIYDNETEAASAANINKASENALKDSRFNIFVAVHSSEETGVHFPDSNLYKELKRQLSPGKNYLGNLSSDGNTYNKELSSYPYKLDYNGNVIYDECTYEVVNGVTVLYLDGQAKYVLDIEDGRIYLYDDMMPEKRGNFYTKTFERAVIEIEDPNDGTITSKWGYRVALNGENEYLYNRAYDEPRIFFFDNKVLMNKITSLELNNKAIRDLTGIEYFVGLKSSLDVSQNYLSNIDPIYSLQANKDLYQSRLQEAYKNVLLDRAKNKGGNVNDNLTTTLEAKDAADKNIEDILNVSNEAIRAIIEAATISPTDGEGNPDPEYGKNIAEAAKAVNEILKVIYDHTETEENGASVWVEGYETILAKNLDSTVNSLNKMYGNLEELYEIYSNEYKLLTLLSDAMNYQDFPEYVTYKEKIETEAGKKELINEEIGVLTNFESEKTFTELEKRLIQAAFPGVIVYDEEKSLSNYFDNYMESAGDVNTNWLYTFREIALLSEMFNYCLIKRMNDETTTSGICYCEEYLKLRIKEFKDDNIDTSLEEDILTYIEANNGSYLFDVFKSFQQESLTYDYFDDMHLLKLCEGEYEKVTGMTHTSIEYTIEEIFNLPEFKEIEDAVDADGNKVYPRARDNVRAVIGNLNYDPIKEIDLYEKIDGSYSSEKNNLYLYEEAIVLSKRLVSSNVERYVILPALKKLDISHNADLSGIERLGELTRLRELYANANYINNISSVDWNAITYLRKLGLSENFITDISCLENLEYLEDLDVSKNLLSGEFKFNFTASQKTLKNLDLSYNQLEDIIRILYHLDMITNGNYANYLAREDTLNIDLSNQQLEIIIEDSAFLKENPTTINVDLPKIFTQLLAIDTERTTFGLTSLEGRIESEGTYVTLNTRTIGEKTGTVSVIPENGYETCIGNGTTATVKYAVDDRTVTDVKITPESVELGLGETQQFSAIVTGKNLLDTTVDWTITGNTSENTKIDASGLLTIAPEETAKNIVVKATSKQDSSKGAEVQVTVVTRTITEFEINPAEATIVKGKDADFTLTLTGENLREEDKEVIWELIPEKITNGSEEVTPKQSAQTALEVNGNVAKLKIGADDEAEKYTVKVTSKFDNTKVAEAKVTLISKTVNEVKLTPSTATLLKGQTQEFTATVEGENLETADKAVTWKVLVEGTVSEATEAKFSENTLILKIAENETVNRFVIVATSKFDETKFAQAEVTVNGKKVSEVKVTPETASVEKGKTQTFTATVNGENLETEDKTVTYTVTGNTSKDTKISEQGVLTVGSDETATTIKVVVTSNYDNTKKAEAVVTVILPKLSANLGYTVEEEYLVGVATKTPVEDFKTKLTNEYTVTIKSDGEEVTSGYMKTGMIVELKDKNGNIVIDTNGDLMLYEVVVKGDINGDGIADAVDSNLIKAYRNEVSKLTDIQVRAADIDDNGKVNSSDSKLLLYHRAEVKNYCLDYTK